MGRDNNTAAPADSHRNVVVLTGLVTHEPTRRNLRSGSDVVNFDLTTRIDDQNVSVPIAWYDPTVSAAKSCLVDEEVTVIGTVRRRFFRSGGATQSRTEVVVDSLVPSRRAKSARSLVAAVAASLTPTGESPIQ